MNTPRYIEQEIRGEIMSTDIFVRLEGEGQTAEAMERDLLQCFDMFRAFESRFSRFKQTSELARFNERRLEKQIVSEEFFDLLEKSGEYHLFTEGLFNPTILPALEKEGYRRSRHDGFMTAEPTLIVDSPILSLNSIEMHRETLEVDAHGARIDFGGIGKGYIIDQVASFLRDKGYRNFFVDAGGDLYTAGKNTEQNYAYWAVDIENPKETDRSLATLLLSDVAATTSGINRRHWINGSEVKHHIIDPRTGKSAETDLVSVTVVAYETALADVLAKSILILGREAGMEFAVRKGLAALLSDSEGIATTTPALDPYLWKAISSGKL